ncbi:DUF2252 domain-containing protein [Mobilicoccus massiliensis]|uniref:DUF2252 domain-containing protein n=1 Tax=Mobilicoccus massiliensis TaxID=1522310 RepID=UPI00058ED6B5|nr:DUF2252 domain-containing protein [Mobilicoccus massiliensis]
MPECRSADPALHLADAFTSFQVPATDRSERVNHGKALREATPHAALAEWTPTKDRPGVVDIIRSSHVDRLSWLFGLRVARMAASPFGFLRGTANLMAHDVAHLPATGVQTTVCGDAHVGNIGFYRSPEGNQVIDLNDFDEAHTGSWEWDLRRLTASIWVLGRGNGTSEEQCEAAIHACVTAYRDEVSFLSKQPLLWRAFDHLDVDRLHETASEKSLRSEIKRAAEAARKRTSDRKLPKIAGGSSHAERIVDDPPLITHPDDEQAEALAAGLDAYLPTLTPQWRRIVGGYTLVDIAHKVVGVGSVGMRAWIALLVGSRPDDVLFLQLKQAQRSVLAPFVHGEQAWHAHQGQRVVEYQQQLQTVSDPLLGWTTVGEHQYYVRQWRNMKGGVPLDAMTPRALVDYAGIVGTLLAKGHARTSGASVISGYLGKKDSAVEAFCAWARAYADQTERDHAELTKAVKAGRLPSEPGI